LSLLFSEKDEVKSFISDKLHIDTDYVYVHFFTKDGANPQPHDASNWYGRVSAKYPNTQILVNDLKSNEDVDLNCIKYPGLTPDQIVFYYLYFLHMPDKQGSLGLEAYKVVEKIEISINGYDFDNLSEGEKKLILIECITNVLGDENSLILLDEPDAHTHIAMKKDLLKLISEFEGQTIMTTHSPMFLNKRWDGFDENNIFYMHDGKIEDTEPLKHLAELTDNEIDYFEGSFILSSKNILVTEGPYDILYLKHAIDKFADENPNYLKLKEQVAFMHAGGANNAKALYQQTLYPFINKIQKLIFIFDYDKEGFEGAEILKESMNSNNDTKPVLLFYQDDYSTYKTRKPNDKDTESYMAEDLFDRDSYINVTNKIHVRSHKELRNITWNDIITSNKRPKGTTDAIKYYIQDNYASFEKEWLQNFKPVLDKLLDVFDLN
jgi:ABC-type multidrug transport system ATPase subunit